jgi:DNA-binding SARP family transcriptional activator/tetratricopeptide (TPR) repeat protein
MDCDEPSARICLLGKPALFIGGRLEPFGGPRKAIALLAYVLLHRERALSRAAVAEQFWPDEEDENARASLRRHLYRALAALPEAPPKRPWVIADKVTLRWNPAARLEIDTNAYERLSAAGQREPAVELYRGDYLEDFYDDWVLPERERLRELQSANLVALIDERRRALDYPGAIAFAQSLLRLDPLREDAIRRLMSLRFAAGDRSGALADFETFGRRLRDELSTDPMPETLALHEAIRSNELAAVENAVVSAVRVARPGFPFTGRIAALKSLRNAWEAAARGHGSTAIVSGEAGVGKTRLIGELVALAESQGARFAFGTTAAIETEPYQPLAEALRGAIRLLRFERLEPVKLAALSALLPEVRELVAKLPELPALEPERERRRLFDAVESALEHLAEKRPLLVVLEDLHWAGGSTIELLEFVVRRLRTHSALVVVSFREEDVDGGHALRAFLRGLELQHSSHVALGPLDADDVRALVAAAVPGENEALAAGLFAASEGNALFVTELLRERLNDAAAEAAPAGVGETVPPGIAATVIARVGRLSPGARTLVETAAVVGVGFDTEVVRQASGWSFAEVFDALDELLDRALVRESPQRRGDFAFSHQLVHVAVYTMLDDEVRRRLHRRIARTLEQLFADRASLYATIARHYDAAGFAAEAVARYLPAVAHALSVSAQEEAIALASRALEICSDARDRFELHRLRELAASRAVDGGTRRLDCTAMTEIAQNLRDDDMLATALSSTIALFRRIGERDDEQATIAALRALGERAASPRWAIAAALAQARLEINRADTRGAERAFAEAVPLVAALADDDLVVEFWCLRAVLAAPSAPNVARAHLENAKPRVGEDRMRSILALRTEAKILEYFGDAGALERVASQLLGLYVDIGDVDGQAVAHVGLFGSARYRFDIAAAREHVRDALTLFERLQNPRAVAGALLNQGVLEEQIGEFERAEADYRRALSIAESVGQSGYTCLAMANLAALESMRGNHVRARELAGKAVAFARDRNLEVEEHVALEYLGTAERELGELEDARDHFEVVLQYRRGRDPRTVLDVLIEAIPAYVGLGAVAGAFAAAAELLRGLEGDRMRVAFPARALWVAASAYAAAGDAERATALSDEARALLHELAARAPDDATRNGYLSHAFHRTILANDGAMPVRSISGAVDAVETIDL